MTTHFSLPVPCTQYETLKRSTVDRSTVDRYSGHVQNPHYSLRFLVFCALVACRLSFCVCSHSAAKGEKANSGNHDAQTIKHRRRKLATTNRLHSSSQPSTKVASFCGRCFPPQIIFPPLVIQNRVLFLCVPFQLIEL